MDRKSAARRFKTGSGGWERGGRPQMMRARSCRCSGASFWMVGTQEDQSLRKGMKTIGQLASERWFVSVSCRREYSDLSLRLALRRGRGDAGGSVAGRGAREKRDNSRPDEHLGGVSHEFLNFGGQKQPDCTHL